MDDAAAAKKAQTSTLSSGAAVVCLYVVNKILDADIDNWKLFKLCEHPQIGPHIQGMKSEINKYHALVQSSTL